MESESDDRLPTEYPLSQAFAIYAGRVALLLTVSLLTALSIIVLALIVSKPSYSILILFASFILVIFTTKAKKTFSKQSGSFSPTDSKYVQLSDHPKQAALRNRAHRLMSEVRILEDSLGQLKWRKNVARNLFTYTIRNECPNYDELAHDSGDPFVIPEHAKLANISFSAAIASLILGAVFSLSITATLPLPSFSHWLIGPGLIILLTLLFRAVVTLIFSPNPSALGRLIRLIVLPTTLFCAFFLLLFCIARVEGFSQTSRITVLILGLLQAILAGTLFLIAEIMSWSKRLSSEYELLLTEQTKLSQKLYGLEADLESVRYLECALEEQESTQTTIATQEK